MYDVASVDTDTQVTLSAPYAGVTASGVVYAIGTGFTVPDSFPEMSQGDIETATIFTRAMRGIQSRFSAIVSDISGKADQATTYTETEVDSLLDDKAAISGQTFTGDIAAPKITASTGILFGTDTAAANTLDDYEEGAWTPTTNGDATGVINTGLNGSYYIKTGRDVTIYMNFNVTTTFTGNTVGGLPFAVDHSGISSTFVPAGLVLGAANNLVSAGVRDDESLIYLFSNQNQSNDHQPTSTIEFYRLQFSYRTA
jgi:hypothetical protein